jgi:integrase
VWEWRYRVHGTMKQQKFKVADYPTEKALWTHLETSVRLLNEGAAEPVPIAVTMGKLIDRYRSEYLPNLAKSTRNTDGSMLKVHIEPMWGSVGIADVSPMAVDAWLKSLTISPSSKGRARRLLKQLIDKAMFWELIRRDVNPMTLVKVKGVSKRVKKVVLLNPEEVVALITALEEPYNLMVLVTASLGLRVEEVVALQWDDFDFAGKTLTIRRAFTHAELGEPKSDSSAATLPISAALVKALKEYKPRVKSEWLFPSRITGGPRSADMILKDYIRPAAAKLKLPKIGWHTFRHSYRAWIGGGKATMSQQKDMMRHADIATTAGYGGTPVEEMRPLVDAVAKKLRPKSLSQATH